MKTDKIFYTLFQTFPELIFELTKQPTELAKYYEFKSVEVKELAFRLDGVFLPDEKYPEYPIYFAEVQFQKDEDFYWRFITEISIYLNQFKPDRPCKTAIIWGNKSLDQGIPLVYQSLLNKENIMTIYLDELEEKESKSLGLGIVKFVVTPPKEAPEKVKELITLAKVEIPDEISQQKMLELIEKIIIYKFPKLSRQELETMFNLTEWTETQFYKEVKKEGKIEGKLETIPLLIKLGLTPIQIAEELKINLDLVQQKIKGLSSNFDHN